VSDPEQTGFPAKTPDGEADVDREVRFAVVMYGGVSLAIYINGVAQELLHMVRATARTSSNDAMLLSEAELSPTELVYRQLAKRLDEETGGQGSGQPSDMTRTRFVVDIISGTSAGGINGVFLAKALARNQMMYGLKQLWLSEGDLGKLLNDKQSVVALPGLKVQTPQQCLLNSERMYHKLLEALDQMDSGGRETSPLVKELDLFVTTTDIDGLPIPIALADEVVYERRYKNVFHFRYATEEATGVYRDDFVKQNDPFLAFAARCTSSFPFAFEPMQLSDITKILNYYPGYRGDDPEDGSQWDLFFRDYLRLGLIDISRNARGEVATGLTDSVNKSIAKLRRAFRVRSFGDGGYLDNKPFSYATSMLSRRQADCAVSRKLLYVEPSPEHPEVISDVVVRPDFAENTRAAVLDLPRHETIREDIDRVYERNHLLERIGILASGVDEDMEVEKAEPFAREEFEQQGLTQMIERYGVSYGAYHRLKVAEITTLLSELIARAAGHDPCSDASIAIRELVKAWRRDRYDPLTSDERDISGDKKTENAFILNFDVRYNLRRLAFLNRRINQLARLDNNAKALLSTLRQHAKRWPPNVAVGDLTDHHSAEFQRELNRIKKYEIAPALINARTAEEKLLARDSDFGQRLYDATGKLRIDWPVSKRF
jgi:patatin-related protein